MCTKYVPRTTTFESVEVTSCRPEFGCVLSQHDLPSALIFLIELIVLLEIISIKPRAKSCFRIITRCIDLSGIWLSNRMTTLSFYSQA